MRNYPLLPPLKDDGASVAPLPNQGQWQSVGAIELDNISRSLKVRAPNANFTDIDSIPSMWARPLLFEMALYASDNTEHPMHTRILGEWRGLLALLALKERWNFPLTTRLIEIPDADSAGAPEFLRALRKLLPEYTLKPDTPWDKLYLILYKGKTIGMTSPTTVVCTSIDYTNCISGVPWYDGRLLCDPTECPELDQAERAAIAGWLNHFSEEYIVPLDNEKPNLNPELNDRITFIRDGINKEIEAFRADLGGKPETISDFSPKGLGILHGLFAGIDKPIAEKEFLTDKLFVVKGSNAFCGALQPQIKGERKLTVNNRDVGVTPILPIKSGMLSELNTDNLNGQITFEKTEKGIKVTLSLPSGLETTREYIEREEGIEQFDGSRDIVEIDDIPVLEIWPNFKKTDWQVYYTYFESPTPEKMFHAVPYGDHTSQQTIEKSSNIEKEITNTSHFPKVMVCKYKDTSDYEEAGVLLISDPVICADGKKTWNIGVDFGTSSTTVYRNDIQDQQSDPNPIKLENRLLQVTESSGEYRARLYDSFFSPEDEQTPFFSFFQYFSEKRMLEPLLGGHIHFISNYKAFPNAAEIFTNLKWSTEPDNNNRSQIFLQQLCLQCAAEAANEQVSNINWQFSYPIAFSDDDIQSFRTIWHNITDECSSATGLQSGKINSEPESIASAKFFASTRQDPRALGAFSTGAICIDIGGETSDISIWEGSNKSIKLRWQASLRLAGRRVFLDILREKPDFLKKFDVSQSDIKLLQEASENEKKSDFYAQADAWIDESINSLKPNDQDKWWKNLAMYTRQPEVQAFVKLMALGISGLLWYIGLILKYLRQEKRFGERMPSVYIGGNGARILDWLANGNFRENEICETRLKNILLDASGFGTDLNDFDLKISKAHKQEAAYGLVTDIKFEWTQEQLDNPDILAGEAFKENGELRTWNEILMPERLASGIDTTEELGQIRNFVESFNNSGWAGDKITLDQRTHTFITTQLHGTFTDFKDDSSHEPVFILALKFLLEWKTNQWALPQNPNTLPNFVNEKQERS